MLFLFLIGKNPLKEPIGDLTFHYVLFQDINIFDETYKY